MSAMKLLLGGGAVSRMEEELVALLLPPRSTEPSTPPPPPLRRTLLPFTAAIAARKGVRRLNGEKEPADANDAAAGAAADAPFGEVDG